MTHDVRSPAEPWPTVLSATELSNSFLGGLIEVCLVTSDHQRTMEGLVRLGIGPWRVYTFDAKTVTERTYQGAEADWAIKVCFADVGDLAVELMQPLYGPSIFQEHLDRHGEGIHHVAFDVAERPWEDRLAAFAERGFPVTQSGRFMDQNSFAFFDTERSTGTTFETYDIPSGYVWPEPERWFPAPPPARQKPPVRAQRPAGGHRPRDRPVASRQARPSVGVRQGSGEGNRCCRGGAPVRRRLASGGLRPARVGGRALP